MSLRAIIRRCEAQLDWLETWGEFRCAEQHLNWLDKKKQVEACLARDPGHQRARWIGEMMGVDLPSRPKPTPPKPHPEAPRETRRLDPRGGTPALRCATEAVRVPILREPQDEVVRAPPPEPEPKPPPEPSHDIPEHMQIRPTHWRPRDGTDVDDYEDDPGYGQCLTEYDVLREEDSS